jgi:hypothetical protein
LAICSDLDSTPDWRAYWEIMRFLNTTEATSMGPGVGLEVGNSIYFDMRDEEFAYWNTDGAGRAMVCTLIHSGHIDCLHSYGNLATTREHACRALDELVRHDLRPEVWVDHGWSPTNFGPETMYGHGDELGHPAYHADLTIPFGIRYVWRGRVTSAIGQDVPPSLRGIWTARHPLCSCKTLAKEAAKQVLARWGSEKYAMHRSNRVLRPSYLRDGSPVYEFLRCNPHWGGVSCGDTARDIGHVLTAQMLARLVLRKGVCILYTHLGKACDPQVPLGASAVAGFRRLARAYHEGRILVATTRRVLGLCRAVEEVAFTASQDDRCLWINVTTQRGSQDHGGDLSASDLDGLTFYVPEPAATRITVNGREVPHLLRNGPDQTGRRSVSLPWRRLEFPDL